MFQNKEFYHFNFLTSLNMIMLVPENLQSELSDKERLQYLYSVALKLV
jgi:hypothetical protein